MYQRVLIPVDGSEPSRKALIAGLQLARESDGCVRVVHVLEFVPFLTDHELPARVYAEVRRAAQQRVDDALDIAKAAGVPCDGQLLDTPGRSLGELVSDEARVFMADLVVLGTHGRQGLGRLLLGSGAEQIVRLAPVPVLVVRAPEAP